MINFHNYISWLVRCSFQALVKILRKDLHSHTSNHDMPLTIIFLFIITVLRSGQALVKIAWKGTDSARSYAIFGLARMAGTGSYRYVVTPHDLFAHTSYCHISVVIICH